MKLIQSLLMVLVFSAPLTSFAQWLWIDKDGHKVFSDRAPPSDVPAKNILRQPFDAPPAAAALPETTDAKAAPKAEPASAPRPSGKDTELEAQKARAEAEALAKQKATEKAAADKLAKDRAQNCERARNSLAVLKSGMRMKLPTANGEAEYISDADRASEIDRIQGFVKSDCP